VLQRCCFVRRKGHSHEDASDLTQAFFALFLEKRYLKSVDAARGKFRTFLLASMKHFLANEWDKSQALKRGGGARVLSLDAARAEEHYNWELKPSCVICWRRWPVSRTGPGLKMREWFRVVRFLA
jgi:DNA-directed RNA polymerase specialized sigma24 family protein